MQIPKAHCFFYLAFSAFPMIASAALMGPFFLSPIFCFGVLFFLFSCLYEASTLFFAFVGYTVIAFATDYAFLLKPQLALFFMISLLSGFLVTVLSRRLDEREEKLLQETKKLKEALSKQKNKTDLLFNKIRDIETGGFKKPSRYKKTKENKEQGLLPF
jgi:hypothetical protein